MLSIKGMMYKEIAVHCNTEAKAKAFLKKCENKGIRWAFNDSRPTATPFWNKYTFDTCYTLRNGKLQYGDKGFFLALGVHVEEYSDEN